MSVSISRLQDCCRAIKTALPRCPRDVIRAWLAEPYHDLGWPPDRSPGWREVLLHRDLDWWMDVVWVKRSIGADEIVLDVIGEDALRQRLAAQQSGTSSLYGGQRRNGFERALSSIAEHGSIDSPIVLLCRRDGTELCAGLDELAALHWQFGGSPVKRWPTVVVWEGTYDRGSGSRHSRL